jgi:hypothetical protein
MVGSNPSSMQQTLERITPEISNLDEKSNHHLRPIVGLRIEEELDTKTSIHGQTQRTNVQRYVKDRPHSTITISPSA